jgi:quercetin dioxygenase-like cupin family protein
MNGAGPRKRENYHMLKKIIIGISLAAIAFAPISTFAENAVTADPEHYTVEFENESLRIIRIKYGPGEKSVMHTHGPNVAVMLSDSKIRMHLPDGTHEDRPSKAGDAFFEDAGEHLPENLGDEAMEVVLIELKE